MPGSSSTWRDVRRVPSWEAPPPRPDGLVPVAGDRVRRKGVFEGNLVEAEGEITDVFPRKANSRAYYRWVANIRWSDGTKTVVRIERLTRGWDEWIQVSEGKKVWG